MIVDLDATLVTAHSDKQGATPTFKYGYGFHPMLAFVDHGVHGSGEALTGLRQQSNISTSIRNHSPSGINSLSIGPTNMYANRIRGSGVCA